MEGGRLSGDAGERVWIMCGLRDDDIVLKPLSLSLSLSHSHFFLSIYLDLFNVFSFSSRPVGEKQKEQKSPVVDSSKFSSFQQAKIITVYIYS